jgi:hypothetical protein
MDIKAMLAGIAIIMTLAGYFYYFRDIFAGKTKPHAFTWLVWASLTAIAFAGQISDNGGAGAYVTGLTAAVSFVIFFLALFRGEKEITRSDWLSLGGAAAALLTWFLTDDPLLAIILITLVDFLGFVPTIRKSLRKPHEETLISYVLAGLKFVLAIIALDNYSVITVLYPSSLVFANLFFVLLLVSKRRKILEREAF